VDAEDSGRYESKKAVESGHDRLHHNAYRPPKTRATERQTPSQEAALQRIKDKASSKHSNGSLSSGGTAPRKVVNYSRQENFE
jgi:NADH:ubiquinone oxidoreductase subunit